MRTTSTTPRVFLYLIVNICILCAPFISTASSVSYSPVNSDDPNGDISISMDPIGEFPKYGVEVPFNITITNEGANPVSEISIIDYVPAGYQLGPNNPNWSADPVVSNAYVSTFAGTIDPSESGILTINLVPIAAADSTAWINAAEVFEFLDGPGGTACGDVDGTLDKVKGNDPAGEDNYTEASVSIFDLALRKELITAGDPSYGQSLVFRTTVVNQGNTPATNVRIIDYIPEGYTYDPAINTPNGWGGSTTTPFATLPGQLNSGEQVTIDITLTLTMNMFDGMAWNNYTEILSAADANMIDRTFVDADSTPNSNTVTENAVVPGGTDDNNINGGGPNAGQDEDDHDPAAPAIYDVAITKVQLTAPPSFSYGQSVEFRTTVLNQGNQSLDNIEIVDYIPCGMEFDQAVNPGWTYTEATRIAHYIFPDAIDPVNFFTGSFGQSSVDIELTVVPCYDDPTNAWTNYGEVAGADDIFGVSILDLDSELDSVNNDFGAIPGSASDDQIDGGGPKADEDEDDHDVKRIEVVDLALTKRLTEQPTYAYGDTVTFINTVYNQGNVVLDSITLRDYLPVGYVFDSNNVPLWNLTPFGRPETTIPDKIFPGDSVKVSIDLVLTPASQESDFYNFVEIIAVQDTTDNFTRNRFDDADSFIGTHSLAERAVIPGSSDDNNILGNSFQGGDSDDHDVEAVLFYDLALEKELVDPDATIEYGMSVQFRITVTNDGTREASNIEISEYLPCGFSLETSSNADWNLDPVSGLYKYIIQQSIPPAGSVELLLNLTLEECDNSEPGAYTNVAEISFDNGEDQDSTPDDIPNNDPEGEDDIDEASLRLFDLSLSKRVSSAATSYSIGDPISFDITVTNEGGTPVQNVRVVDYLPCGYAFTTAGNTGWAPVIGQDYLEFIYAPRLNPGETFTATLNLTVQGCTIGGIDNYRNGAEIAESQDTLGAIAGDTDSTPDTIQGNEDEDEDDYDEANIDLYDLALEKTRTNPGVALAYGNVIDYTIDVTNEGNLVASGIEVTDYIPCGLAYESANNSINWIVDAITGYASYTIPTDIQPGTTTSVTISLTLEPCTTPAVGAYNNMAEISIDNGDDNDSTPDDDPNDDPPSEDDIDDEPLLLYDLSLNKAISSIATSYDIGDAISFDIVVTNEGAQPVQNVRIVDYLPCGYTFSTANNTGWAEVTGESYLEFTNMPTLNVGETFTATLNLTVADCPDGQAPNYTNGSEIARAEDLAGDPVNDTDSTPDTIQGNEVGDEDDYDEAGIEIYDLALTKTRSDNNVLEVGALVSYTIEVTNEGSVRASGIEVTDYIPCGLVYEAAQNSINWDIDPNTNYATYTIPSAISAGETVSLNITLRLEACDTPTTAAYDNKAEISVDDGDDDDSTPNDDPNDDPEDEDDSDNDPLDIYDLSLTKEVINISETVEIGDVVTYNITVTNEGNRTASDIIVIDYIPCGLSPAGLTNTGWVTISGSNNLSNDIGELQPGESSVISIQLRTVLCDTPSASDYVNESEIVRFNDEDGGTGDDWDSTPDDIPGDPESEDDNDTAIIVIQPDGIIGGDVWKDLDSDGIQDVTEPGIPGIIVNLYTCTGELVASTTTGSTGFYVFLNVVAGNYQIEVDLDSVEPGCEFTLPNQGNNDERDSDVMENGFTDCINFLAGAEDFSNDAGLVVDAGSVGDYVFLDSNGNGLQDFNETGIPNVTVKLYTTLGTFIDSTLTDSNGAYLFDDVEEEDYYVEFIVDDIYIPTDANVGFDDNRDSDVSEDFGPGTTSAFTLDIGEDRRDIDAGFYECATICGYTWIDLYNENDVRDDEENGVNGMNVILFRRVNNVWIEYQNQYAGLNPDSPSDDGYFDFCVPPGQYYLEFVLPPIGLVQVQPLVGFDSTRDSDVTNTFGIGTTSAFIVGNGTENCGFASGYTLMAQVGNAVWMDDNLNGLRESNEDPVAGVIVQAYNLEGDMVAETTTDEQGHYNIDYLQKQEYFLKFIPENGLTFTQAGAGNNNEIDSDVDHSFGPNTTRLFKGIPGETDARMDAGLTFGALPVEWLSVKAEARNTFNLVSWSTASETNNDRFVVQKANALGDQFEDISIVKPNENDAVINYYEIQDSELDRTAYYYRIAQYDIDGRVSYSKIVTVNRDILEYSIYPNPAHDKIRLRGIVNTSEDITVIIYDQIGRLVKRVEYGEIENSEISISIEGLSSGIYKMTLLKGNTMVYDQNFVKE